LALSCFDLVSSISWALSSLPLPTHDEFGDPSGQYGARGNHRTCQAQAFLVQLGYTSVFYNVALAVYYVLAVVYGWRETKLKQIRIYLHGAPIFVGLMLASAGIPFASPMSFFCYIPAPGYTRNEKVTWFHPMFLTILPISISILATIVCILMVYIHVRATTRKARRWTMRSSSTGSSMLEQRVLIQFVLYLVSFYLTWPLLMTAQLNPSTFPYPFWVAVTFVGPLQGFTNAAVYACPRFLMKDKRLLRMRTSLANAGFKIMRRLSNLPIHLHHTTDPSDEEEHPLEEIHASDDSSPHQTIDPSVAIAAEFDVPARNRQRQSRNDEDHDDEGTK